ncbi:MAG: ion transporter [Chitinophagaceae bacterium]|nr:MAG: ion transporter [Chitinophagaceae bacterium]
MAARSINGFRSRLYRIIFQADTPGGKLFDLWLLVVILLSILSIILESVASIRNEYYSYIRIAEWIFTISFTLEYILRVYSSPKPARYIFSFYGFIDLISFLPTYIGLLYGGAQYIIVVRALRLLRIFRILKLSRFLYEGNVLINALKASSYKITVFLTAVVTMVTIVGTLMYQIEGGQNGFTSIPVSIYWAIVTITTVGYGDVYPQTPLGQFLASILMVTGYGIIAVPTGIVSVEIAKATDRARASCTSCDGPLYPENRYCGKCGAKVGEQSKSKDAGN